jgi:hypothetical protein
MLHFMDIDISDQCANAMDRLHQPFVLEPCKNAAQRRARDAEFFCQGFF